MNDHTIAPDAPAAAAPSFGGPDMALAAFARALAHPARLSILRVLAARQACVCGEIVEAMPLAQATVSQHLKVLRGVGLVQGEIDGPRTCYCLDPAGLAVAEAAFSELFAALSAATCPCPPGACACRDGGY